MKCRRDVTIELLHKAIQRFKLNPEYLFTGEGNMFSDNGQSKGPKILCIVTDQDNAELISYVPVPAQAGYAQMNEEPTFIHDLPTFSLPDQVYQQGTHRAFDVKGDSMEPTLFERDKVVCSYVEANDWHHGLKNTYVYVVVTTESVFLKRLSYSKEKESTITLTSDNAFYQPFELHLADVREIWLVSTRISPFLPSPTTVDRVLKDEITDLKAQMSEQTKLIESLYRTIESLMPFRKPAKE